MKRAITLLEGMVLILVIIVVLAILLPVLARIDDRVKHPEKYDDNGQLKAQFRPQDSRQEEIIQSSDGRDFAVIKIGDCEYLLRTNTSFFHPQG